MTQRDIEIMKVKEFQIAQWLQRMKARKQENEILAKRIAEAVDYKPIIVENNFVVSSVLKQFKMTQLT